jgi:O-antigen ligase
MIPKRVKLATWLALCLQGLLILTAQYRLSYDAFTHMFFADHYLKDWWALWEPRWYTGFEVTSYPPLTHQLMGLFGHVIGVDFAFGLILWGILTAYPIAIYAFSRIFVGQKAASYASIGAAVLPSLYLTAHTFGQLPTLAGTLFALFGSAVLADYLRKGDLHKGLLAVGLFTTMMAAHHAVLLFVPFIIGATVLRLITERKTRIVPFIIRFVGFVFLTLVMAWAVIWPFWDWGRTQDIQTPIDHLSRHNFLSDPHASQSFFLPVYGLLIPFIPLAFRTTLKKRFWGLGGAFSFLFVVGLGGTTPLPRWLFGSSWEWLTYDRFAFWASITLLPFFGVSISYLHRRRIKHKTWKFYQWGLGITAIIIGLIPTWLPTQPPPVDMQPIVDFLAKEENAPYRYLTFGFGDQFAYLSRLTKSTTIDGSYHSARTLPELRKSGIGQIDTTYWLPGGLAALDPILQKSDLHGVRWGFVARNIYETVLARNGWKKVTTLSNGVSVWENSTAIIPPSVKPPPDYPFQSFSWGFFPLFALFATSILSIRKYWEPISSKVLSSIVSFGIGLLPLSLTFWYFRRIFAIEHDRIYFTYSDVLFFLSDGLAIGMVLIWLINKIGSKFAEERVSSEKLQFRKTFWRLETWLIALCVLATLSVIWSIERRTALYVAFHLWLCLGVFYVIRDHPVSWRLFAIGCCAALFLQGMVAIWEFITQSTAMTLQLGINWPGDLVPEIKGASIVQTYDGVRWLRAYGTMPHPNLLGGFALAMIIGPVALLMTSNKQFLFPAFIFILTLVLLVLTFSRSAWLGLIFFSLILFFNRRILNPYRLKKVMFIGGIVIAILITSLLPLFSTRLEIIEIETEQVSEFTRKWLVDRTWELIRQQPLLGTGIGSFSLALSQHVEPHYGIEPVHNVILLAGEELGIAGFFITIGLAVVIINRVFFENQLTQLRTPRPQKEGSDLESIHAAFSATIMGMLVIGVFDHYFWTVAPGRLLFFAVLGIWAGVGRTNEHRC